MGRSSGFFCSAPQVFHFQRHEYDKIGDEAMKSAQIPNFLKKGFIGEESLLEEIKYAEIDS